MRDILCYAPIKCAFCLPVYSYVVRNSVSIQAIENVNTCKMMQVIEIQVDMPIFGAVTLYSSLLKFTLHVHPDRLDYADQVLV